MKDQIIWMPHPGHFICGDRCQFRLNIYVNGYIVSTVGEYEPPNASEGKGKYETIGSDRLYNDGV